MNKIKRKIIVVLCCILFMVFLLPNGQIADAAKKIKLNKTDITVKVGKTKTVKLLNSKKKAVWKVISGKKCIEIIKKKKTSVKFFALKEGTAKIRAKVGAKKYICRITVISKKTDNQNDADETENDYGNDITTDSENNTTAGESTSGTVMVVRGQEDYDYAYEVLKIVNETRAAVGLHALSMDKSLLETAMQRAAEISVSFSHTRPNGSSCFSIFRNSFIKGENIAYGQKNPESVMNSWINSPGHYSNIIEPDFQSIGIGCFLGPDGRYNWVQCFDGSPSETPDITGGKKESARNVEVVK